MLKFYPNATVAAVLSYITENSKNIPCRVDVSNQPMYRFFRNLRYDADDDEFTDDDADR